MTTQELHGLVRQGMRYLVAAEQDANPVIAHLHYNYAVTFLRLAREGVIGTGGRRVGGVDVPAALERAKAGQDRVQLQLLAQDLGV